MLPILSLEFSGSPGDTTRYAHEDRVADIDKAAGSYGSRPQRHPSGASTRVGLGALARAVASAWFPSPLWSHAQPRGRLLACDVGHDRSRTVCAGLPLRYQRTHQVLMTHHERPLSRDAMHAPGLGSAQAPQQGWASRACATGLRCLEDWRPGAAGRTARRRGACHSDTRHRHRDPALA